MDKYHLVKQFSKPEDGEYVPITFIEFTRKLVGWSPGLRRSVYVENEDDKDKLKRVREVNLMIAINHLSGNTSSIELTDEEMAQFEEVYNSFIGKGGQLMYTRKKVDKKTVSFFEVHETGRKTAEAPGKYMLSDRM
ncbi:MAG: hypothetical protein OIN89_03215 [Candidatus Methanoperedens sp.]|jgi:uncharacterized protein with NRDE domain|nr:hypothetical protein [Candidatus Methanoperedens sp.]PKL54210.1 MAG: hypothetical protein CVV36_03140 [Candidatus Methanoperedenaceae archaeon HGW-Methanoperedenaceae-1]